MSADAESHHSAVNDDATVVDNDRKILSEILNQTLDEKEHLQQECNVLMELLLRKRLKNISEMHPSIASTTTISRKRKSKESGMVRDGTTSAQKKSKSTAAPASTNQENSATTSSASIGETKPAPADVIVVPAAVEQDSVVVRSSLEGMKPTVGLGDLKLAGVATGANIAKESAENGKEGDSSSKDNSLWIPQGRSYS